ncbi:hypothetical protein [Aggregatibacter kilianii]|uniref:hypothetical protein n=1 Tax=Aggregatibacter kilianii TaxID=2025884 RepID=UPI000D64F5AE|nr:hypothetical protein [Aggregatibacter kilianii]
MSKEFFFLFIVIALAIIVPMALPFIDSFINYHEIKSIHYYKENVLIFIIPLIISNILYYFVRPSAMTGSLVTSTVILIVYYLFFRKYDDSGVFLYLYGCFFSSFISILLVILYPKYIVNDSSIIAFIVSMFFSFSSFLIMYWIFIY